jgi:F-type H+-transporting ATPase subunit b
MNSAIRVRTPWLALIFVFTVGASLSLRAQQAPAQSSSQSNSQASPPTSPQQKRNSKPRQEGFARQLAHESREASVEGADETAEFKQSASVVFVARITGLSLHHAYLVCVLLNFAIIAGVIFWVARKYLPGMFRERTTAIQKAMQEAQKASAEARRRLADIDSRLTRLDGEIGAMRDAAEKDAAAEEARIRAAAEGDARKIVESAEQEIAAAIKAARRELTAYAADLAVGLAQKQIRVDAATDQALVSEFIGQLNTAPGGPEDAAGKGGD